MHHSINGKAWRDFDMKHPLFASEIRNVRLGLASYGFNPFGDMSLAYNMWPVVVTVYNLPLWLCMKPEYIMLTLLILGPKAPGKDIDIFLRSLVDELKELWADEIDTRDTGINNRSVFKLRVALLWTVNDFPARSSLSGWSGQGYMACSMCNEDTSSVRVIEIIELCTFFKQLCARTVKVSDMMASHDHLALILCKFERIFSPTFFDIKILLEMYLSEEAIFGSPVHMRWMYPFERYLKKLKGYVRNRARPEGSIVEEYFVDEALTFCSRYLEDIGSRFNRPDRNEYASVPQTKLSIFQSQCRPLRKKSPSSFPTHVRNQEIFYILNNCYEVEPFLQEHRQELLNNGCPNIKLVHIRDFHGRFYRKVMLYMAYVVKGVRFLTYDRDIRKKNSEQQCVVPGTGVRFTTSSTRDTEATLWIEIFSLSVPMQVV
ncbi:Transposon protein [Abeliophyllum distichum]|uniref:Transposon protein n=1 Tax=Abeliophyllum distichum TaxID=126358 RepID=A0ABD1VX04_9LAMI